ncbi:hypothetical protein [Brevundimonas sanguinis]|uniref:hypothetical protein n=1 Tax=Brevundimonas sanguinis TaxID=3021811 RepID=UPI0024150EF0|nr:hypothetical protein [Brevundimonas sp. NCCP 15609]
MVSKLPSASVYAASAAAMQLAYDVAALSSNLALARDDDTGTYADECRRCLAKISASTALIERAVQDMPRLKSEAA